MSYIFPRALYLFFLLVHRVRTTCFVFKSQQSSSFRFCCLSLFSVFLQVAVIYCYPNFVALVFFLVLPRFAWLVVVKWKFLGSIRLAVEIGFGLRAQADFVTVEWLCSFDKIVHVVLQLSQYLWELVPFQDISLIDVKKVSVKIISL